MPGRLPGRQRGQARLVEHALGQRQDGGEPGRGPRLQHAHVQVEDGAGGQDGQERLEERPRRPQEGGLGDGREP